MNGWADQAQDGWAMSASVSLLFGPRTTPGRALWQPCAGERSMPPVVRAWGAGLRRLGFIGGRPGLRGFPDNVTTRSVPMGGELMQAEQGASPPYRSRRRQTRCPAYRSHPGDQGLDKRRRQHIRKNL